jgi:MinD-like ATPase involved in chromosome partitioning or flagellar assembly
LVFSPELWVEALHRHLSHHGGARVRQIVVEPSVALEEDYDVLVVSDRWPALTYGFVGAVHECGRAILGVFDPDEPAGKDHLVDLGVDVTIASDADVGEFVTVLQSLDAADACASGGTGARRPVADSRDEPPTGVLVAVSGPRGSGVTEVALGIAVALTERRQSVVLLDAHEAAPALAGRLGLGLEPNLRTAVDACAHGLGSLDACVVEILEHGGGRLGAVAGHPSAVAASQVSVQDVLDVVAAARRSYAYVVADLEERSPTAHALTGIADVVVGVMHASPVGVVRALEWTAGAFGHAGSTPLHLVVNQAPRGRFRQEEIRSEITRTIAPTAIAWCPYDRAVERAAWDGTPTRRGAFHAACATVAGAIPPAPQTRRRRRPR